MLSAFHNVSLVHDDSFFLVLYNNLLIDYLHSVEAPVLLEPTKKNFREPSRANQLENLERLESYFLFLVETVGDSATGFEIESLSIQKLAINASLHQEVVDSELTGNRLIVPKPGVLFTQICHYIVNLVNRDIVLFLVGALNDNYTAVFTLFVAFLVLFQLLKSVVCILYFA